MQLRWRKRCLKEIVSELLSPLNLSPPASSFQRPADKPASSFTEKTEAISRKRPHPPMAKATEAPAYEAKSSPFSTVPSFSRPRSLLSVCLVSTVKGVQHPLVSLGLEKNNTQSETSPLLDSAPPPAPTPWFLHLKSHVCAPMFTEHDLQ